MDEIKNQNGPTEPEVSIGDLDQGNPLNHCVPFLDFKRHLCYDSLQLCSNG